MLLMLFVTISLTAISVFIIVKATREAMDRLGVDPMSTLLWLGLAERPTAARVPRPPRP